MRVRFGGFYLDEAARELRHGDQSVRLEPQAFDVLCLLVRNRDRVVSKQELLDMIWGSRFISESGLTSRIKQIRRALGDDGRRQSIVKTVHSRGYRFVAEVSRVTPEDNAAAPPCREDPPAHGNAAQHNLTVERTPLFGRAGEIDIVVALVEAHRLVSVLGMGGSGKTRLAGAAAFRLLQRFPDGAWFVDLVPADDERSVAAAIAAAVGRPSPPQAGELARLVGARRALLVLDNCEHVRDQVAAVVDHLLAQTAHLHVLVTSREPLGLIDEHRVLVGPLDANGLDAPAVQLFRSVAARFGARLEEHDLPVVHRICHHLDGLPLAIELAAAQMSVLRPSEIADRLNQRFELLQVPRPAGRERHASLSAVLEDTWTRLSSAERELLERLADLPGSFTVAEVEQVSTSLGWGAQLRTLAELVGRSLVVAVSGDLGGFRVMESVRLFAWQRSGAVHPAGPIDYLCVPAAGP